MNKLFKFFFWSTLFVLVACSNLSNLCGHGNRSKESFLFRSARSADGPVFEYGSYNFGIRDKAVPVQDGKPEQISWKQLQDVKYVKRWNKEYQTDYMYPVFGNNIKKLQNKKLAITGYMIPLSVKDGLYAISRYNYASCFFCGQSGPESVISLKFKTKPRRYKTDEYLTVQGLMELNDTNVNDFIYIFRATEEIR